VDEARNNMLQLVSRIDVPLFNEGAALTSRGSFYHGNISFKELVRCPVNHNFKFFANG
jgi:hypothetical protein